MCPWIPDPLSKHANEDSLRTTQRNSCSLKSIEGLPIHGPSQRFSLWTKAWRQFIKLHPNSGSHEGIVAWPWPGFNVAIGRPVADDHYKLCLKVCGRPNGLEYTTEYTRGENQLPGSMRDCMSQHLIICADQMWLWDMNLNYLWKQVWFRSLPLPVFLDGQNHLCEPRPCVGPVAPCQEVICHHMPIYSRIVTQNAFASHLRFTGHASETIQLWWNHGGIWCLGSYRWFGILQIPWFHGSSMAMIMVCKNFRIQIIQIYSDDFRWQCWLQSCGSPWFSPIKKRLNWWIERRLGWGWCEDRRDQCRSRSAEWRWSLGFLWISGGSQRLEKQTIDSIDEHRWK